MSSPNHNKTSIFHRLASKVAHIFGSACQNTADPDKDKVLELSKEYTAESVTEIGRIISESPDLIPYGFECLAPLPSKTAPGIINNVLNDHPEYLEQGLNAINQMPTAKLSSFAVDYAHQNPERIPQVMATLSNMSDCSAYFAFQDLREAFPDHELIAVLEFDNMQDTWAQDRMKMLKLMEQQGLVTMDGDKLIGIKFRTRGDDDQGTDNDDGTRIDLE